MYLFAINIKYSRDFNVLRRSVVEEHENHERWLISYADFITLLFAFFVVMYSISQINESKYRVMSESLESAFAMPERSSDPIQIGEVPKTLIDGFAVDDSKNNRNPDTDLPDIDEQTSDANVLPELAEKISEKLKALTDSGLVSIKRSDDWLEIEMKSGLLFQSGSANLNPTARILIEELGALLIDNEQLIRIRGYTDNLPIKNEFFASNWELSSSRAAHVVRMLQAFKIDPRRMAVEGFSQYHPIDSNTTAVGRAKNRRVVLAVSRATLTDLLGETTQRAEAVELPKETNEEFGLTAKPGEEEPEYEIVRLKSGGLLIRSKVTSDSGKQ